MRLGGRCLTVAKSGQCRGLEGWRASSARAEKGKESRRINTLETMNASTNRRLHCPKGEKLKGFGSYLRYEHLKSNGCTLTVFIVHRDTESFYETR